MRSSAEPNRVGGSVAQGIANGRGLLDAHPQLALEQAKLLLRANPAEPRVLRLAAAAHRKLGETALAEEAELAAIQHSLPIPELAAAAVAEHEGRSGEASEIAARRLQQEPEDLLAMTISAESAISLKVPDKAEPLLRHVVARAPQFLRAQLMLGRCLLAQHRIDEAIAVLEQVIQRQPDNLITRRYLARMMGQAGRHADAAALLSALVECEPDNAEYRTNLGDAFRFLGRRADSESAYRQALEVDPDSGPAWWSLANLDPRLIDDHSLANMEGALERQRDHAENAGHLHFALGMVYDQRGEADRSFEHFAVGNNMRLAAYPYDPAKLSGDVDQAIGLLSPQLVETRGRSGHPSDAPVFILGMPRSGSTLVERILGQHSAIEAVGELAIIPMLAERLNAEVRAEGGWRQVIGEASGARLATLGETYIRRAQSYRKSDAPHFIDKLHMNWRHIALIRLILPNARIIDVRRNALDCCWSNFKLLFAQGHPASNSLEHLGRFYADYVRMMDHVDRVRPGAMLRVHYEKVIDDIEGQTRRILDFLNLNFEDACLNFHTSTAPVATASSEQVRRPINRDGLGTWQPYAQWLGPLRDALGPLADDANEPRNGA